MSTRVASLTNIGDLKLLGEVSNRIPPVKNGLIGYYPFDGGLTHISDISNLKVLEYHVSTGHGWLDYLSSCGANITNTSDLLNVSISTALQYDLILVDGWVWGLDSAMIPKLKQFVDAGISCLAIGNDTRTNCFVSSYVDTTTHGTHDIVVNPDSPIRTSSSTYTSAGSADLYGGISTLDNGAIPLYYRADTGAITGYLYESKLTKAVLYFDQEGTLNQLNKECINYVVSKSTGQIVTNNCSFYSDGVYVEDSTTNLWNGLSNTGASGSNWSVINNPFANTPFPNTTNVIRCTPKSSMNYYTCNNTDGTNNPSGTVYTFSAWVFVDKTCDCQSSIRISGEGKTNGQAFYDKNKLGTWQHLKFTVTSTDAGFYFLLYANTGTGDQTWTKGNVYYANVQVEKKNFATAYTQTVRGVGSIKLPVNINPATSKFTISYKLATNGKNSADNGSKILLNNFGWIWAFSPSSTTDSRCYIWDYVASTRTWRDLTSSTPFSVGVEETITMTWDLNALTIYRNDVSWAFIPKTNNCTIGLIDSILVSDANVKISDLCVYNRVLDTSEIKKLCKTKFSLTSDGDLNGTDVSELNLGVPSDAYYYPLDFDAKDVTKMLSASRATNLIFDEGSAWVGTPINNLITSRIPNYGAWNGQTGVIISKSGNIEKICSSTGALINALWGNALSGGVENTTYTYSAKVKGIGRASITTHQAKNPSTGADMGISSPTVILKQDSWTTLSITYVLNTGHTSNNILVNLEAGNGSYVEVTDVMITTKQYVPPFSYPSNGTGYLAFNFYDSIGLDWSKDWSMVYWKKPIATANNSLTGYSMEYLGVSANPVGGGQFWWGKPENSNFFGINGASSYSINPSQYFGNWHMISVQKTGTTITVKKWSPIEGITTVTGSTTNTVSNYYVTNKGYDFIMGWNTDQNGINSYYRDLVVVKGRCMTDAEVTNMYKRKMSQKESLYLQGQLIENVVL